MRLGPSVGCGARAHSGPCPYWFIWLAVLCQGPLQAAPQGLGLGIRSPVRYPAAAGVSLRPSRPQSGHRPRLRGPSGRRSDCGPPQGQGLQQQPAAGAPARLGGGTPSEGPRAATPARRAGPEGRTAPQPPHSGGRAAPEHLRRNRHGGGAMQGPLQAAPKGLGLALRRGAPVQRLAANLTGPGPAGARPWPPHYPGQTPQGAGRGGRRHAAQGGQGCGPQAAGGGWDGPEGRTGAPTTARRRWPPSRCPQQLPAMGAGCGE